MDATAQSSQSGVMKWVKGLPPTQLYLFIGSAVFVGLLLLIPILKMFVSPPKFAPQQQRPRWEQTAATATSMEQMELKSREAALRQERENQQRQLAQFQQEIGVLRQELIDTRTSLMSINDRLLVLEARRGRVEIIRPDDHRRQQGYLEPSQQQAPDTQPKVLATIGGRTWLTENESVQQQPPAEQPVQGTVVTAEP
ncbi:MAG: hypothetical protein FWF12_05745 [Betaproteobacteria bacterium]|nr:hypothetical protein [Betaproteobacteria bacterium]